MFGEKGDWGGGGSVQEHVSRLLQVVIKIGNHCNGV
jgi:hypothetical protein